MNKAYFKLHKNLFIIQATSSVSVLMELCCSITVYFGVVCSLQENTPRLPFEFSANGTVAGPTGVTTGTLESSLGSEKREGLS